MTWFDKLLVISGLGIYDNFNKNNALQLLESEGIKKDTLTVIKELDFSNDNLSISKEKVDLDNSALPPELKSFLLKSSQEVESINVVTSHQKYNKEGKVVGQVNFDLEQNESEGTKKMFYFIPLFLRVLTSEEILIIDELDTRLHPSITHKLIELFNSKEHNKENAQLIFTTHDTNLLNRKLFGGQLLRRNQIWFTEKDKEGATDLYSLVEYDVPEDTPFESDYIKGKYGAIPFIGNIDNILSE